MNRFLFVIILSVPVVLVGFFIQWLFYRREFKAFLAGSTIERTDIASAIEDIELPPEIAISLALDRAQNTLSQLNMRYVRNGQSICAFSRLLANYPFRLIIQPVGNSTLRLKFSDRHYKYNLLRSEIKRAEKRFKKVYNRLKEEIFDLAD
jgi:hypothetical protein